MNMIDVLKNRSAAQVSKQIEESKESTGGYKGFEHEVQMKQLYDTKAVGKDIGYVRMRLIPNKHNETGEFVKDIVPVREFFHKNTTLEEFKAKQNGTKYYIAPSRASLNKFSDFKNQENNDPMQEFLNSIFEKHTKEGYSKDEKSDYSNFYSEFKATQFYIANVYIEECEFNPQLEGKVVAFKFGNSIFKEIEAALKETTRGKTKIPAIDVFNMLEDSGASLSISVDNEKGSAQFVKYRAVFEACEPLLINGEICTEEQALELFNSTHDIFNEYITKKVKSYDEAAAYFAKQYGFAHDKNIHGSAFQAALKENINESIPEEIKEEVKHVEPLKTDEVKEESVMEKFKRMQKEKEAKEKSES